jgi:hypothetical protein
MRAGVPDESLEFAPPILLLIVRFILEAPAYGEAVAERVDDRPIVVGDDKCEYSCVDILEANPRAREAGNSTCAQLPEVDGIPVVAESFGASAFDRSPIAAHALASPVCVLEQI